MKLVEDENSDLVHTCLPMNESLFKEVFNIKLWQWYKEAGLINDDSPREFLHIINGYLLFDQEIKDSITKKNFLSKIFSSLKFSYTTVRMIKNFSPQKINQIYEEEFSQDYSKTPRKQLIDKFIFIWNILIDNMKYSVLANLIIQYNIKIDLQKEYNYDIVAERYNAVIDLSQGLISKKDFDNKFGFYSDDDYDLSHPRYYELKKITPISNIRMQLKSGNHNFREFVKMQNIKMIALLRKIILALEKEGFFMYKEELVNNIKINIKERKNKTIIKSKSTEVKKTEIRELSGVCLSGDARFSGEVKILKNINEFDDNFKDVIIVTDTASPDLVAIMPMILAIITQRGGKTSHLAIVARERNFPIIGQVENATTILQNGQKIRLDVKPGKIYLDQD